MTIKPGGHTAGNTSNPEKKAHELNIPLPDSVSSLQVLETYRIGSLDRSGHLSIKRPKESIRFVLDGHGNVYADIVFGVSAQNRLHNRRFTNSTNPTDTDS